MNIETLIARLQKMDGHRVVFLASDGEGNSYSMLTEVQEASYLDGVVEIPVCGSPTRVEGQIPSVVLWP